MLELQNPAIPRHWIHRGFKTGHPRSTV